MSDAAITDKAKDRPFGSYERSLAFRYLRAKREHGGVAIVSMLSLVGIALAVAALVIIMSMMNGFRAELISRILGASGHVRIYTGANTLEDTEAMIRDLTSLDGVETATPLVEGAVLSSANGASMGAYVRGMRKEDAFKLNFLEGELYSGTKDTFGVGRKGGNDILITERLARRMALYPGSQLTLVTAEGQATVVGARPTRKTYNVAGIFEVFSGNANPLDDVLIMMPLEQAQLFFNARNTYPLVEMRLSDPQAVDEIAPAIHELLPDGTPFQTWKQLYRGVVGALEVERSMMRIVFLVLITITALNIITGIVMLVKNKGRDIAILRTIGASRGSVMRIFVMVGAILGITGTAIGLVLGLTFCWQIEPIQDFLNAITNGGVWNPDVYGLPYLPAKIDWFEVTFATIYAFVISVGVAILPAWNAARMDPVEALRFE